MTYPEILKAIARFDEIQVELNTVHREYHSFDALGLLCQERANILPCAVRSKGVGLRHSMH